jgi:purine-cytosine permease-like protein
MAKQAFSKMKPSTMFIVGTILVLILPISLIGFITTSNSNLLVLSMLGVVTIPVGVVMLVVGFIVRNQKK